MLPFFLFFGILTKKKGETGKERKKEERKTNHSHHLLPVNLSYPRHHRKHTLSVYPWNLVFAASVCYIHPRLHLFPCWPRCSLPSGRSMLKVQGPYCRHFRRFLVWLDL